MKHLSNNKIWLASAGLITVLMLAMLFSGSTEQAAAAERLNHFSDSINDRINDRISNRVGDRAAVALFDQQIFNEDFVIEEGEVIDESVTVFRGDVDIAEGGVLNGDLSVFSGDVEIAGTLNGDLAVIGGDVDLEDNARVTGDVSVVGGSLDRAESAFIGGNFVGSPRGDFENFEAVPEIDVRPEIDIQTPAVRVERDRPYILSLFLRLLQSILWTVLITGMVLLLSWLFPRQLREVRKTGEEQPALSFAVGLVTALAVLLVGAILAVTVCLLPFSVLLWALLAMVTLVGWAVLSAWLGDQIQISLGSRLSKDAHPLIPVALGALLLTGATFFAWSILPCIGWIVAILLGATGNGAVLVHLARRSNLNIGGLTSSAPRSTASAADTTTNAEQSTVIVRDPTQPKPVEPAPAATNETTATTSDPAAQPVFQPVSQPVSQPDAEEIFAVEAPTVEPEAEETAQLVSGDELGLSDEERRQLRQGAGIEGTPDDFTKIRGIGPAFSRRLVEAGVTTYAQLAAMTAEQIAAIVGWPPERVVRDQLREQAAALAAQAS